MEERRFPVSSFWSTWQHGKCVDRWSSQGSGNGVEQRSSGVTNGGTGTPASGSISVPARVHSITQQYLAHMSNLYQCHELWEQADAQSQPYKGTICLVWFLGLG